jgi:hypothetical protein
MTLKEKFDKISCWDCDMPYCDIKCTILSDCELTNLEQIADEFAIGFADWVRVCKLKQRPYNFDNIKELLEIYKKEKGL